MSFSLPRVFLLRRVSRAPEIVDATFIGAAQRTLTGLTVDETAEFERLDRRSPVDDLGNFLWTLRETQRRQTRSDGWSSIENTRPVEHLACGRSIRMEMLKLIPTAFRIVR